MPSFGASSSTGRGELRSANVSDDFTAAYLDAKGWITRNEASVWHVYLEEERQALTVSVVDARVEKIAAKSVSYEQLLVETVTELKARMGSSST